MHNRIAHSDSRLFTFNRSLILALLPMVMFWPFRPSAASSVVNNCTNDSALRTAVLAGGTVTFSCPANSTITLATPINIDTAVRIDGANGGQPITLSGGNSSTVKLFIVNNSPVSLELDNLTVKDAGDTAIVNSGSVIVDHVTFSNNHSVSNNAAISGGNALTIRDSKFIGNSTGGCGSSEGCSTVRSATTTSILRTLFDGNISSSGGGAVTFHGLTMAMTETAFINNTGNTGGAIFIYGGDVLSIANTDFISNTAVSGGAIDNNSSSAVNIAASRFANNTASGNGGAIITGNAPATISSTLFYNNRGTGSLSAGGAINAYGALTLTNSTLANNLTLGPNGGGLFVASTSTQKIINSTLVDNSSVHPLVGFCTSIDNGDQCGGNVFAPAGGHVTIQQSIIYGGSPDSCGYAENSGTAPVLVGWTITTWARAAPLGGTGDITVDPFLSPLDDHGGPSVTTIAGYTGYPALTRSPYTGSPVVDTIPNNQCATNRDQRNANRPETPGTACDMGAVEAPFWRPRCRRRRPSFARKARPAASGRIPILS